MKILWITWKDWRHPTSGGAEVVMREIVKRLVDDNHQVTILTAHYPGSAPSETVGGVTFIRIAGSRYVQPFVCLAYYYRHLRNKYDVIVEVVNTAPYFTPFFKGSSRSVLFYHQLARQIWFHETPFPLSVVGYYILEPVATFLLGRSGSRAITISSSTKSDLMRFGFRDKNISIISEGIEIEPVKNLASVKKYAIPTLLSFGAIRPMKRTLDQVKAFELAKRSMPDLQLKVAGDSSDTYGQKVLDYISSSQFSQDIEVLGKVSRAKKIELMQKCHLIIVTSVKEGWGLIVTESNSQGTPAVVYDVDGLRDSVRHNTTGSVCDPTPGAMVASVVYLLKSPAKYAKIRENAHKYSKEITFEKSYSDFTNVLQIT